MPPARSYDLEPRLLSRLAGRKLSGHGDLDRFSDRFRHRQTPRAPGSPEAVQPSPHGVPTRFYASECASDSCVKGISFTACFYCLSLRTRATKRQTIIIKMSRMSPCCCWMKRQFRQFECSLLTVSRAFKFCFSFPAAGTT